MQARQYLLVLCIALVLSLVLAVPVPKKKAEKKKEKKPSAAADLLPEVSYRQYLSEVVALLEGDKQFSQRIANISKLFANGDDTEDLASQLEFVDHEVRTRLDEIKRKEVERLNALEKMVEAKKAANGDPLREAQVPLHPEVFSMDQRTIKKAHVDHENPHSFEVSDLEKLIRQVTADLHQVDKAKEEQYKEYEMTKEHLRRRKLKKIKDPKARAEEEKKFEEQRQRHKQHEKVHQPGSREQLEDAWVKEDHMDKDSFNPKTFFAFHDINGDGHLDVNEIESLFNKELEKVYNRSNDTTVNKFEMEHEMERMRQQMLERVDTNKDMMVSLDEFLRWTNNPEYKKDEDWKTSEEADTPPYKDDEFKDFEDEYDREHPDDDDDDDEDGHSQHRYDSSHKAEAESRHHEQPQHPPQHPPQHQQQPQHPPEHQQQPEHHEKQAPRH